MNKKIPGLYEQQIILTCKGHNAKKNSLEAIKLLLAKKHKIDIYSVSCNLVYQKLIELVSEYAHENGLYNFAFGLFEYQENINIRQAIQNLIEILANIVVVDDDGNELIELKPDKNLLNFDKDY